jgi:predicted anti-sigma-YlaC factor YlaD
MSPCKTANFFFRIIPVRFWRDFLIRRHVETCPACQAGLVSREEARSLLVLEQDVARSRSVWPEIGSVLVGDAGKPAIEKDRKIAQLSFRRRRWATAAAAVLLIVLAGYWIFKGYRSDEGGLSSASVPQRFEIEYIRVGGLPANSVVYQPAGSDMIVVWAGKNP